MLNMKDRRKKSSTTLILVCPSSLSLRLCSESQLQWGLPGGRKHCETRGQHSQRQPRAAPPWRWKPRVVSLPAAGHLPTAHHSAAALAPGARRYPRLCPRKGGWFGTVSPRSASNPDKLHLVPKTSDPALLSLPGHGPTGAYARV